MSVEISTIVAGAERLGEGAVWDTEDQRLWWVDITGGLIHCYNPEDKSNQSFAFGEPVGCIARREHGGLLWLPNRASGFLTRTLAKTAQ